jgi:hypothetical protein
MIRRETKVVTLKQLRQAMLEQYPSLLPLALSTIARYLKNKLQYSYKKINVRPLKASTQICQNHISEIIQIQMNLISNKFNIVYVDESSISASSFKPYNWSKSG